MIAQKRHLSPSYTPAVTSPVGVYRARRPRTTPLWQTLDRYLPAFLGTYEERYESRNGSLRSAVLTRLEAYLKCGILDHGFARFRCGECGHEFLVAFSCKGRGLCPSCQKKRQAEFAEFVAEHVLEPVPHRQMILSVPRRLRPFFQHHRHLLASLARCGYETVKAIFQTATGRTDAVPGAIVSVQTFGSLLDFHPHLHILATWGVFEATGAFVAVEDMPQAEGVEKLFRHKVLRMLLDHGVIDDDLVRSLLALIFTRASRANSSASDHPVAPCRFPTRVRSAAERDAGCGWHARYRVWWS